MSFNNKVVLITGGSSGIGATTAILFAKENADVAIVGRDEVKLNNVAAECAKVGKKPLIIKADVSKDDEAKTIVHDTINAFGKLDILVNSAGLLKYATISKGNLLQVFYQVMATNLRAVIHITSMAAPHLIKTEGNIVNISSLAGTIRVGVPAYTSAFGVSKYCLNHFSRCAALELGAFGVRVNTITPGAVNTSILEESKCKETWSDFIRHSTLKKISEPEEVADLIFFLASDKAKSITGANYVIDNGMQIRK